MAGKIKAARNALRHGLADPHRFGFSARQLDKVDFSYLEESVTTSSAMELARAKADPIRISEARVGILAELLSRAEN